MCVFQVSRPEKTPDQCLLFFVHNAPQPNLCHTSASTSTRPPSLLTLPTQTVKLVSEFERIIYISCNPETLLQNLKVSCDALLAVLKSVALLCLCSFGFVFLKHHLTRKPAGLDANPQVGKVRCV